LVVARLVGKQRGAGQAEGEQAAEGEETAHGNSLFAGTMPRVDERGQRNGLTARIFSSSGTVDRGPGSALRPVAAAARGRSGLGYTRDGLFPAHSEARCSDPCNCCRPVVRTCGVWCCCACWS